LKVFESIRSDKSTNLFESRIGTLCSTVTIKDATTMTDVAVCRWIDTSILCLIYQFLSRCCSAVAAKNDKSSAALSPRSFLTLFPDCCHSLGFWPWLFQRH